MSLLKLLLIGTGRAGMIHGRNYTKRLSDTVICDVCDANGESAQAAASEFNLNRWFTDYRTAIEETDAAAVIVVTPTKYHHEIVLTAAKYGKHIFCEKPMAMTVEECDGMIQAAQNHNVKLQIGFMRRFDRNFVRAQEMIAQGDIGDVVAIRSVTHGPSAPMEWMYDVKKSNGPLAEVSSHDIDTVRFFSRSEITSLYALAGNYRCPQVKEKFPDFYDTVIVNMRLANGGIGCLDGAQGVQYGYDARVDIQGTDGLITIGGLRDGTTVCHSRNKTMTAPVVRSWMNLFADAYVAEAESFARCIANDEPPSVSGWDGRQAVAVVQAGNESIRTGKIVAL